MGDYDIVTLAAKRVAYEDNKLYPLPEDYYDLTGDGQRDARCNAVCFQETPSDVVWAWNFFVDHYLAYLPQGVWYNGPRLPSPPAHYRLIYDIAAYPRNIQGMPRAFGKSKLLKSLILMFAFSRPFFKVLLVKSHDDFVSEDFGELKWQLTNNERLIEDFGNLKPKKGEGNWKDGRLQLTNGFRFVGRSVMGKMLGFRPNFVAFDDAEFDPAMRVSPTILTENIKYLWYYHIVPMLEEGCTALMLGTLNHRKSFLYYQATVEEHEDPRVQFFNRVILGVKDEFGDLVWKDKWDEERIEEIEAEVGRAAFLSMYMNDPGTEDERVLPLHPVRGYYTVTEDDDEYWTNPLVSNARMLSSRVDTELETTVKDERPFGATVNEMYRVLLADPIRNPSSTSDYACAMVVGIERSKEYMDTWWVLDIKLGKVKNTQFMDWLWELGHKWMVRVVGIEAISVQKKLVEQIDSEFAARSAMGEGWIPKIRAIRYTGDFAERSNMTAGKAARIASMAWRYETDKIRYPRHLMPLEGWRDLKFQTENFTENLRLLPYDDAIETLAMTEFVPRPRSPLPAPEARKDIWDLIRAGEMYFPGSKMPVMGAINAQDLTGDVLAGFEKSRFRETKKRKRRRKSGSSTRRYSRGSC